MHCGPGLFAPEPCTLLPRDTCCALFQPLLGSAWRWPWSFRTGLTPFRRHIGPGSRRSPTFYRGHDLAVLKIFARWFWLRREAGSRYSSRPFAAKEASPLVNMILAIREGSTFSAQRDAERPLARGFGCFGEASVSVPAGEEPFAVAFASWLRSGSLRMVPVMLAAALRQDRPRRRRKLRGSETSSAELF